MSAQSSPPTAKMKFAFSEDAIRQMYEMAPTKAKDYDDSRSVASSTEERSRVLNISSSLDEESEKIAKVSPQDDILGKFYEISSLHDCKTANRTNSSQGLRQDCGNDDLIDYEVEMEQLTTENKTLRAKLSHCESMKSSINESKKCIESGRDSEILEDEKRALMLELERFKLHCEKLESFNENFLSENVSLKKGIEHLLSEKNALLMSLHKFESLDKYVEILEAKISALDEVAQEQNQLKLQVMRQKEIAEEFANLQQRLKTLTNQRDTLNIQLLESSKKYAQQEIFRLLMYPEH